MCASSVCAARGCARKEERRHKNRPPIHPSTPWEFGVEERVEAHTHTHSLLVQLVIPGDTVTLCRHTGGKQSGPFFWCGRRLDWAGSFFPLSLAVGPLGSLSLVSCGDTCVPPPRVCRLVLGCMQMSLLFLSNKYTPRGGKTERTQKGDTPSTLS